MSDFEENDAPALGRMFDPAEREQLAEGLHQGARLQVRSQVAPSVRSTSSVRSTNSKRALDKWAEMAGNDFNGPGILDSAQHAMSLAGAGTSIAQVMKDLMGRELTNRDQTTGFRGNAAGWQGYKELVLAKLTKGGRGKKGNTVSALALTGLALHLPGASATSTSMAVTFSGESTLLGPLMLMSAIMVTALLLWEHVRPIFQQQTVVTVMQKNVTFRYPHTLRHGVPGATHPRSDWWSRTSHYLLCALVLFGTVLGLSDMATADLSTSMRIILQAPRVIFPTMGTPGPLWFQDANSWELNGWSHHSCIAGLVKHRWLSDSTPWLNGGGDSEAPFPHQGLFHRIRGRAIWKGKIIPWKESTVDLQSNQLRFGLDQKMPLHYFRKHVEGATTAMDLDQMEDHTQVEEPSEEEEEEEFPSTVVREHAESLRKEGPENEMEMEALLSRFRHVRGMEQRVSVALPKFGGFLPHLGVTGLPVLCDPGSPYSITNRRDRLSNIRRVPVRLSGCGGSQGFSERGDLELLVLNRITNQLETLVVHGVLFGPTFPCTIFNSTFLEEDPDTPGTTEILLRTDGGTVTSRDGKRKVDVFALRTTDSLGTAGYTHWVPGFLNPSEDPSVEQEVDSETFSAPGFITLDATVALATARQGEEQQWEEGPLDELSMGVDGTVQYSLAVDQQDTASASPNLPISATVASGEVEHRFPVISLCAGSGSLDAGLSAGIGSNQAPVLLATDNWDPAIQILKANHPAWRVLKADITTARGVEAFVSAVEEEMDPRALYLLTGGLPCQGFVSMDPTKQQTYKGFLHILEELSKIHRRPAVLLLEQTDLQRGTATQACFQEQLFRTGYITYTMRVNALISGVAQARHRDITIGVDARRIGVEAAQQTLNGWRLRMEEQEEALRQRSTTGQLPSAALLLQECGELPQGAPTSGVGLFIRYRPHRPTGKTCFLRPASWPLPTIMRQSTQPGSHTRCGPEAACKRQYLTQADGSRKLNPAFHLPEDDLRAAGKVVELSDTVAARAQGFGPEYNFDTIPNGVKRAVVANAVGFPLAQLLGISLRPLVNEVRRASGNVATDEGVMAAMLLHDPTGTTGKPHVIHRMSFKEAHIRCGHVGEDKVRDMAKASNFVLFGEASFCQICKRAKATKHRHSSHVRSLPDNCGHLQVDTFGPAATPGFLGTRYIIGLIDLRSKAFFGRGMKTKGESAAILRKLIPQIRVHMPVEHMLFDGAAEFKGGEMQQTLLDLKVKYDIRAAYDSRLSGSIERSWRTLTGTTLAALYQSGLPLRFWDLAYAYAVDIYMSTPHSATHQAPGDKLGHRALKLEELHPFGCTAVAWNPAAKKISLNRGVSGLFVGWAKDVQSYLLLVKGAGGQLQLIASGHVTFDDASVPRITSQDPTSWEELFPLSQDEETLLPGQVEQQVTSTTTISPQVDELDDDILPEVSQEDISEFSTVGKDMQITPGDRTEPILCQMVPAARVGSLADSGAADGEPQEPLTLMPQQEEQPDVLAVNQQMPPALTTDRRTTRGAVRNNLAALFQPQQADLEYALRDKNSAPISDATRFAAINEGMGDTLHELGEPSEENDEEAPSSMESEPSISLTAIASGHAASLSMAGLIDQEVVLDAKGVEHVTPRSLSEALLGPDALRWQEAIFEEQSSISSPEIAEVKSLPPGIKPIPVQWVFKLKTGEDGLLSRFKARMTARGDLQENDVGETYSPTAPWWMVRLLLATAAQLECDIFTYDVGTAFLEAMLPSPVWLLLPRGWLLSPLCKATGHLGLFVKRAIYGLRQSPRMWYLTLATFIEEDELRWEKSSADPCLFFHHGAKGEFMALLIYVDDTIIIRNQNAQKAHESFLGRYEKRFRKVKSEGSITKEGDSLQFLGATITRRGGEIIVEQSNYIAGVLRSLCQEKVRKYVNCATRDGERLIPGVGEAVSEAEYEMYRSALGSILYLSMVSRPDLAWACSLLGRFASDPRGPHLGYLRRVLGYVRGTADWGLHYRIGGAATVLHRSGPKNSENVPCSVVSGEVSSTWKGVDAYRIPEEEVSKVGAVDTDADLGGCQHTRRSTSGMVMRLGTGAIAWRSTRQARITTSTRDAELGAFVMGLQFVEPLYLVLQEFKLDATPKPIALRTDNQAALAAAQKATIRDVPVLPEEANVPGGVNRELRMGFIQECGRMCHPRLENLQPKSFVRYGHVETGVNTADIMTKGLHQDKVRVLGALMGLKPVAHLTKVST